MADVESKEIEGLKYKLGASLLVFAWVLAAVVVVLLLVFAPIGRDGDNSVLVIIAGVFSALVATCIICVAFFGIEINL
jgi:hypothetical protein